MTKLNIVQVLVPRAIDRPFDYLVPDGLAVNEGDIVSVPLGQKVIRGVVWSHVENSVAAKKLKSVREKYDIPPMPEKQRKFIEWVAEYTLSPLGNVLAMALNVPQALEPEKKTIAYKLGDIGDVKITATRQKVIDALVDGDILPCAELARVAAVSSAVVRSLVDKGVLLPVEVVAGDAKPPALSGQAVDLTKTQKAAATSLQEKVSAEKYSVTLLEGVTGSGKTEVYFEVVYTALASGKQALVMVPEISLTAQLMVRFEKRFGFKPALWHSALTSAQRRKSWRAIAEGRSNLVVGARSALFLPYKNLGIIIVDEEHESSYKQEDGVVYHGRDMAVARGYISNIPVVLASATPSLETQVNAQNDRYDFLHLPERHGKATLPDVEVIDMRAQKMDSTVFISPPLRQSLQENIAKGEQSLLYLNRRGYAPLTLCRHCGYRFQCDNCSAWMVVHKYNSHVRIGCHHCGSGGKLPEKCPECAEEDSLVPCGPGVERIEEEVRSFLPDARIAVMSSDIVSDTEAVSKLIDAVIAREIDIIIGTQMVAKGHHFPHLTLVGIVDGDAGLEGGDLRATEKSYQLLHQVSGRAGREELPGRAIIQSYNPTSPVLKALMEGAKETFLQQEIRLREQAHMPPFGRLATVTLSALNENTVRQEARKLARTVPHGKGFRVLGPAPAPIVKLRNQYRYRFLVKAERNINTQKLIKSWLAGFSMPSTVRVKIDIDPYNFV